MTLATLAAGCHVCPTPYVDADGDGFGTSFAESCEAGGAAVGGDCDDRDAAVNPDADELCDGVDHDCDGLPSVDAVDALEWFVDADGDGFGFASLGRSCEVVEGATSSGGDCDDEDPEVNPGAIDVPCDGIDSDCDGDLGGTALVGVTPYDSIQAAVSAAPSGSRVVVCPGVHEESVLVETDLEIVGVTGDPADVVIRPELDRALEAETGSLRLGGLSFFGGATVGDGGNVRVASSELVVEDCVFEGGIASNGGGLAWVGTGGGRPRLRVERTKFMGNSARTDGGGLWVQPLAGAEVLVWDVTFEGNQAAHDGGGLWVWPLHDATAGKSAVDIDDSNFRFNVAGHEGGGLAFDADVPGDFRVRDSTFASNDAPSAGGGAYSETPADFVGDTFIDNTSARGAALSVRRLREGHHVALTELTVADNPCSYSTCSAVEVYGQYMTVEFNRGVLLDNEGGLRIYGGWGNVIDVDGTRFEGTLAGPALNIRGALSMAGGAIVQNPAGILLDGDLLLDRVDLGVGDSDNALWDLDTLGATEQHYDGITSLRCVARVCTP